MGLGFKAVSCRDCLWWWLYLQAHYKHIMLVAVEGIMYSILTGLACDLIIGLLAYFCSPSFDAREFSKMSHTENQKYQ